MPSFALGACYNMECLFVWMLLLQPASSGLEIILSSSHIHQFNLYFIFIYWLSAGGSVCVLYNEECGRLSSGISKQLQIPKKVWHISFEFQWSWVPHKWCICCVLKNILLHQLQLSHSMSTTYCSLLDSLFYIKAPKLTRSPFMNTDTAFLFMGIGKEGTSGNTWIRITQKCVMECVLLPPHKFRQPSCW